MGINKKPLRFVVLILLIFSVSNYSANLPELDAEDYLFDMSILVAESTFFENRVNWVETIKEELTNLRINVSIDVFDLGRIFNYPTNPTIGVPVFKEGGYDMFVVNEFRHSFDYVEGDAQKFLSYETPPCQYYCNIFNFKNSTVDNLIEQSIDEFDDQIRIENYKTVQKILHEELPVIVVFEDHQLWTFSENINLSPNDVLGINSITHRDEWKNLEETGLSTIKIADPNGWRFVPISPFDQRVGYVEISEENFLNNMVFQGLLERDQNNDFLWKPLIAQKMPAWNNDHTIATITIRDDVYFADGVKLTIDDVVESYKMHMNTSFVEWGGIGNGWLSNEHLNDLLDNDNPVLKINETSIQFKFKESALPEHRYIFDINIIPTHVYGNHTNPSVIDFVYTEKMLNDTLNFGFGTGPFRYSNFTLESEISLDAVTNYWNGPVKTDKIVFTKISNPTTAIQALSSGEVQILTPHYKFTNNDLKDISGISYESAPTGIWFFGNTQVDLGINLNHPIFGTGLETPVGMKDPSKASLAAKNIRKAVAHAIPLEKLAENPGIGGIIAPGYTQFSSTYSAFDDSLVHYDYDLNKAKELLDSAFVVETETSSTSSSSSSKEGDSRWIFSPLMIIPILLIRKKTTKSFRKN